MEVTLIAESDADAKRILTKLKAVIAAKTFYWFTESFLKKKNVAKIYKYEEEQFAR